MARPTPAAPALRLDAFAMIVLTVLCATWGFNQVAIKVANGGISPVMQSGLRAAGATFLVFVWCRMRGIPLFSRDGTLAAGLAAGVMFALEFMFIFWGLTFTSAARAVIVLYSMPFFVAIGAHLFIAAERLSPARVAGLLSAFAGLLFAFADSLSLPSLTALTGDVMMLAAAVLWAATTLVIKTSRLSRAPAEKTLLYQLGVSAVTMLPLSLLIGEPGIFAPTPLVLASLAFQTVWVAAITYVAWFWLMARYPASHMSTFVFLTPLFGVLSGGIFLGERISPALIGALVLVALGIYLVNRPQKALH